MAPPAVNGQPGTDRPDYHEREGIWLWHHRDKERRGSDRGSIAIIIIPDRDTAPDARSGVGGIAERVSARLRVRKNQEGKIRNETRPAWLRRELREPKSVEVVVPLGFRLIGSMVCGTIRPGDAKSVNKTPAPGLPNGPVTRELS